jgi:hypothetical protein
MKQTIAQASYRQSLFLCFLCFEIVMAHSDWGCLDDTGLPRSIKLLLCEQYWAIVIPAAAQDV